MLFLNISNSVMIALLVISIIFLIVCLLEEKINNKKSNSRTFNFDDEDINNMF